MKRSREITGGKEKSQEHPTAVTIPSSSSLGIHTCPDSIDTYLSSLNTGMDYLAQEYGIVTTPIKLPDLPPRERTIATSLFELLKIINDHMEYWSKKNAPVTLAALHKAKTMILGLLDAI